MSTEGEIEQERDRCRRWWLQVGTREMDRRLSLYDDAQKLCYALVTHKSRGRDPRVEPLLIRAEDRRERRHKFAWGLDK